MNFRIRTLITTTLTLALCNMIHGETVIDNNLIQRMDEVGPKGTVSTLVYLVDQVDVKSLSDSIARSNMRFVDRHQLVVETLQATASSTQGSILASLKSQRGATGITPFWISNVIRVDARPDVIHELANRSDVLHIYLNYEIELVEPVRMGPVEQTENRGGVEQGITAIRATEAWAMGYTGEGVLVATLDTGVDGNHEALASRWAGLRPEYSGHPEWAFLDPYTYNHNFPFDSGSHGTHTMGTVCGGSPGLGIGVAPDAHWITSAGIDRSSIAETVADAIETFQWFLDPDGNPATAWDVPRVCSNSWGLTSGHGYPNCDETFWTYLDALEAAGCVVLFSAGNEGSSGLRRPGDRATDDYRTCAVAAIDPYNASFPIASFSSRGPTNCTPSGASAIKPDISAPGVSTYSSVPGGYSSYDGTSMASPHINGAIALILQANPNLSVEEVKEILYVTAVDLGSAGEDNDYGHGIIDCVEAVNLAIELSDPCEAPLGFCPQDIDGDYSVNVIDLLSVIDTYGVCGDGSFKPAGDVDGDCCVTVADILSVVDAWGNDCTPVGACCLPEGGCSEAETEADCLQAGGEYNGDDSTCDFSNCPDNGACCFDDGSCTYGMPDQCIAQGGAFQGNGTACDTTNCPIAGAGDECTGPLIANIGANSFETNTATPSSPEPDEAQCAGSYLDWDGSPDIWFIYVAAESRLTHFTTCDASSYDTSMVLYEGTCDNQVACNGDAYNDTGCQSYHSEIDYTVQAGSTYYIRIGGWIGSTGSGTLTIN
ncbi:MAG: S8 family serine peptidase [Phycisphaerales bacterium]|nr:S8 family serine peptidase [Phycisphaerales bacterium]